MNSIIVFFPTLHPIPPSPRKGGGVLIIKKKDDAPRKSFSLCIPGIPFVAAAVIIYGVPGSEKKKYLLRNLYDLESCNHDHYN